MTDVTAASAVDNIVARLERLPTSWWQIKAGRACWRRPRLDSYHCGARQRIAALRRPTSAVNLKFLSFTGKLV